MSVRQAQEVAARIQRLALPLNSVWNGRHATVEGSGYSPVELRGGMNITLLSPRPEDLDRLKAFTDQSVKRARTSQNAAAEMESDERPDESRRRRETSEGPIDVESLAGMPFVADRSVANNASIAFLAEHHGTSLLVCGDASATVLAESIRVLIRQRGVRRLRVDAFVVPHCGSAGNLDRELLELVDCHRYFIATNGERYGHPNRETIARILAFGRTDRNEELTLVFNYRTPATAVWEDAQLQARWNYRATYPSRDDGGIKVQI